MAEQEARSRGYTAEDMRLASFAVVAFLDESVLNLRNPVFADWPRQPLQEELFGHHVAGGDVLPESAATARSAMSPSNSPMCWRSSSCACCSASQAGTEPGRRGPN